MTCIVAIAEDNTIHMAGDRMAAGNGDKMLYNRRKVFINGDFVIGYTDSFRLGQLMEFSWKQPDFMAGQSEFEYMCTAVVDSIKKLLTDHGVHFGDGENLLIGYGGKLFTIQGDYSVFEYDGYAAVGCGNVAANASLHTSNNIQDFIEDNIIDDANLIKMTPEDRLSWAIEAAANLKTGVSVECDYITSYQE